MGSEVMLISATFESDWGVLEAIGEGVELDFELHPTLRVTVASSSKPSAM